MRKALLTLLFLVYGCLSQPLVLKVATYNIYWLDDGILELHRQRLRKVIRVLNADAIAFQEINSRSALENILPKEYRIVIADDPDELQEVALAVRKPLRVAAWRHVFPDREYEDAYPRMRDLLEVEVSAGDRQFLILVHHGKSRSGGRLVTDPRREKRRDSLSST